MTSLSRKLLLAFATLGLGASLISTYVHHGLLTQPGFTSFCDVNTTVSCAQAYLSRYGSFWGIPVAIGGVLFFTLVLLIVGVAGRNASPARENAPAYVFALSTIGLAFVLYLAWASFFVLKTFCILCAITYVAVIALFIISGGATSFPMKTLPGRARRDIRTLLTSPVALVITLLLAAGTATVIAAFPREGGSQAGAPVQTFPALTDDERVKVAQWWEMQPQVPLPIPDDGAKVLVVKFNDYQCGACKLTFDIYRPMLTKYQATGQLKYVTKQFPLEPECNPTGAAGGNHFASCEAAAAVIMGRSKGTSDKMEEWLFSHIGPPMLSVAQVRQAARDVGGITDFDAQYPRALEEIKTDAGLGVLMKVNQTPTFYINGRKLPQIVTPPVFEAVLELELKRAK
jgi:uncharacterized membrane protein/protein-disulfide isomerase